MYTVFHILYIDVKRLYYLLVYYLEFASFSVLHIFVVAITAYKVQKLKLLLVDIGQIFCTICVI